MKTLMICVQSFVLLLATVADGSAGEARFQHLNVGERSRLASPDGVWQLAVSPAYPMSDRGGTPVVVRRRGASKANVLLVLHRDAFVYWGRNRLLIVDAPYADYTRVHLFQLQPTGRVTPLAGKPDLDTSIGDRFKATLRRADQIVFYYPWVASWTGSRLLLTLGVTTVQGSTGPMTPHCYRITVDSRTGAITGMEKGRLLDGGDDTACKLSPP